MALRLRERMVGALFGLHSPLMQHHRQLMQWRVAKSLRLDRLHGGENIVAVDAGLAVALPHMAELFRQ
jgi:hypothetical protein